PTHLYPLSLHDALPISPDRGGHSKGAAVGQALSPANSGEARVKRWTPALLALVIFLLNISLNGPLFMRGELPFRGSIEGGYVARSEEHTSELQSRGHLV